MAKGHYKDKCPELAAETIKPTKDTKKEVAPKKIESMNTVESNFESEAAFLATYELDSEENDWFSEGKLDESINGAHDVHSPNNSSLSDASDIVQIATELASSDDHCDNGV